VNSAFSPNPDELIIDLYNVRPNALVSSFVSSAVLDILKLLTNNFMFNIMLANALYYLIALVELSN
jgi:hypothetical protein